MFISVGNQSNYLKVLHGCDSDVEWLQRDFSVYLVNVFDTHQVSPYLNTNPAWLLSNCFVL